MAEWKGALECIEGLSRDGMREPAIRELAEVMEIESRRQMGLYPAGELSELVLALLERVRLGAVTAARVRAMLSAAILSGVLRSDALYPHVRRVVDELAEEPLGRPERGMLHLAKAFTYYHARENGNGLNDLLAALECLATGDRADSTIVQIHSGLGAIASSSGQYTDGKTHLETAYLLASRLDNAGLMGVAAMNLAIVCSRLGIASEHRAWALNAWRLSKTDRHGSYGRIHSSAECCFSAISLDDRPGLSTARAWLDQSIETSPLAWTRQAGYLFKADVAWLLGDRTGAFEAAGRARSLSRPPLAPGLSGHVARWSTLLAIKEGTPREALELLRSLDSDFDRLDALDRAEMLSCLAIIEENLRVPAAATADRARQELARLPLQCAHRLVALGLPLPHGRAQAIPEALLGT